MDYLTLLQRPILAVKYDQSSRSLKTAGGGPLDDFWYQPATNSDDTDPATLFRSVAWVYRSVDLRAHAVASMPFRITSANGETELDTSDNYQNKLGWLPNPRRLFYLTEAALTCYGSAYWWRERNRVVTKAARYMRPDTVTPQIDATGLTGFVRIANGERKEATLQDVVYFWQPDAWVELGPPESSPLMAAIAASGVLYNLNQFSAAYFKRGAIKATLLTVQGAPVAAERDRLKTWWRQMVSGVRNAWSAELVNADAVTPVVIGEGLKELSSAELTAEKRQDIATALGIPSSVIFSESAGGLGGSGVVTQDEAHFYSKTIVPECELIAEALNEQVLEAIGYRLEFLPQTLDVFQEDENQRAAAFASYVAAGLPVDLVAEMLGLELPPNWTYEMLREQREKREEQAKEQFGMETPQEQPQEGEDEEDDDEDERDAKALADLRAWRRKSAKRGKLATFDSEWIPATVVDDVKAHGSNGWRDALDGVIAVYAGEEPAIERTPSIATDTTELVAALRSATEALLHGQPQPE